MNPCPPPPTTPSAGGWKTAAWPLLLGLWLALGVAPANAAEFDGRPVRQIELNGLDQIESRVVENQLRSLVGKPYDEDTVQQDIVRITSTGYFAQAVARVTPTDDGGVVLSFDLDELPLLEGVEIRGNRAIETAELRPLVLLRVGDPVDRFLIERAEQALTAAYEEKGYFVTDVSIDRPSLDNDRRLVFLIREGPRIRLRRLAFEGNTVFGPKELKKQIRSGVWTPIFGRKHVINREELKLDAARLRDYYRQRGYLEAEVDRRITVSNDQRDAVVTFLITEGPRWTVNDVRVEGFQGEPLIFTAEQLVRVMELQPGEIYSRDRQDASVRNILDLYGMLGYLDTRLVRRNSNDPRATGIDRLFNNENNTVDLLVTIRQGTPTRVGKVTVRGNSVTRTKVILRELRGLTPGRPFDRTEFNRTERRLNETPLFSQATITLLGDRGDDFRDVLVEVNERNTGSIQFGATISSDSGLLGAIDITQRNFDVTDLPESWDDFFANRAFRGGGQTFNLTLQPGSEDSRYSVSLSDPFFLDSDFFIDTSLFFSDNERDEYDERRGGGRVGIGKRFGDVWSASAQLRGENVRLRDIEPDASLDVFEQEGTNVITSASLRLRRSTTDSNFFPTRGSRTTLSVERAGALGGEFNYTKASVSYDKFWTVSEDFLERKSVLRLRLDGGYIFEDNEAPIFERFYAGGHTSFRGFESRGVGPRGIRADTLTLGDDPIGGDFLLLAGMQYEFPLVDNYLRGVVFTDQGILDDQITLEPWRVSVGMGIRLQVAFLSQAPFAIDFSIPIVDEDTDEERAVSFAIDIPFQ